MDALTEIALVLAGGVGLGAFQGGVYDRLSMTPAYRVSWVSGSSIGGINAALIAGNKPADRIERLRNYWMTSPALPIHTEAGPLRHLQNWTNALQSRLFGAAGHFRPRLEAPWSGFKSFYSLQPTRTRILEMVDFGRLNSGEIRVSIATTDIETGDLVLFDTGCGDRIEIDHLLASCGYLPEFAPVEIDRRLLGDGGLSANAPIEPVVQARSAPSLIFLVDLFARDGERPKTLEAALTRKNDLLLGNQTYRSLEAFRRETALRAAQGVTPKIRIIYLSYRPAPHEAGPERVFDYSRPTLEERWRAGEHDCAAGIQAVDVSVQEQRADPVISIRRAPENHTNVRSANSTEVKAHATTSR